MNKNYTVYHLHDEDSLLDSCTNYKLYIDKAVELGQKAIAFTNHGNIYNWIERKMYCDEKGIKYIHGIECYLTRQLEPKVRDNYHTILLAKNQEGFKELNKLVDLSTQEDHFYYKPRLSFDEFFNISDNIIKISACLASPLSKFPNDITQTIEEQVNELQSKLDEELKNIAQKADDKKAEAEWICSFYEINSEEINYDEHHKDWINHISKEIELIKNIYEEKINEAQDISKYREIFDKLLQTYDYYEIQPHVKSLEQIKYNQMLYEASKQYRKPLIAGTDTHSINQYKAECRSILQKAKRIEFTNEDSFDLTYKSYDELVEMFRQQNSLPMDIVIEAIENTNRMADSVEDFVLDKSVKYPKLYDNEEEVLNKRIAQKLKEKLDKGIIDRKDLPKYTANILEEMRVFKKINMVGFMLFMSELVCWCWDNGIPIGPCRGSVGGSTVAYITDIIDVNPVVWNTIFSRFANEDREEVGDIDIDIAPDQRDLVYQHIIESFGYDKTAYILAIGTVADKGAIDEIGRALDIPLDEVAKIKELYSTYKDLIDTAKKRIKEIESTHEFEQIKDVTLEELKRRPYEGEENLLIKLKIEYDKKQKELNEATKLMTDLRERQYPELFYYFDGLVGTAVSQSFHPAGIVVSPVTLPDNYGTFWNDGKRILCINMEEIHDGAGLVKYDLLALKNIQIIRKTCEYAGIKYPKSHEINWNDQKVWDDIIISPAGIFQFESPFAYQMLHDYSPRCVNDLSIINASLRPSGASYRDRLLAKEPNKNPSPIIDELLKDNNGYLIFQEDTIKFLQNICGLSGSEADNVRRAIGRKQMDRLQKALPQILEGYCNMSPQPRDVAEEEAKTFLKIIEDSSRYQFGYNHSTGYSMIGYMCAYLRYYYPEEFIAAYLNCASNSDDIVNGTELAKIKNISINNIKFGHSRAEYTVDKKNHALYKGIESIKFCNAQIAEELYELSKNHYDSFPALLKDINEKTSVNSRQLTILTILDFFSDFGKNKYLLDIIELCNGVKEDKKNGIKAKPALLTAKQIKKDKMEELGISEYLAQKYCLKETAKQYSQIDNLGLVTEMAKRIEDKSLDVISQVKAEQEYLEYVVYANPNVSNTYYIVTEYKHYKEARKPYVVLHNLHTGEDIKTRIKSVKVYESAPFGKYSILKVKDFTMSPKVKNVNGEWVKTEELEPILTNYEVIKE